MRELFRLERWHVVSSKDKFGRTRADAGVKIEVNGKQVHTAAEGVGPVDALYNALRKALRDFYPEIDELELVDYLVHIENSEKGTAAKVKVVLEMRRGERSCIVKSASANILEASWDALTEALSKFLIEGGE